MRIKYLAKKDLRIGQAMFHLCVGFLGATLTAMKVGSLWC